VLIYASLSSIVGFQNTHYTPLSLLDSHYRQHGLVSVLDLLSTLALSGLTLTYHRLYNNPDYSDLTIILSDSREIKVHKNILCTANEWFKKACGVDSRFAVRRIPQSFHICLLMNVRHAGSLAESARAQA